MNKIIHSFALLFTAATISVSLNSCSNSHAENGSTPVSTVSQTQTNEIPRLLTRAEGLGSVDENIHVAKIYDEQVAQLKRDPSNVNARLQLTEIFINEARITGEHPYYYPKALEMLRGISEKDFKSDDQQFRALYLEASVLLSLHDFEAAFKAGDKARTIFPYNAGIYGVLVDSKVEMGNYDEAVALCDKMVSMRPDLRSYARVSYLREIHGEVDGAIDAMKMAIAAGVPGYEQHAWCRLTLGKMYETYKTMDEAEQQYRILLQERPNYPFALAGLARVEMAKKNYDEAEKLLADAIEMIPEVGFYELKAELHVKKGEQDKADALYPEILSMMKEDSDAGHNMDLELAGVHLELGHNPSLALESAHKAMQGREDNIEVNAMLARIYDEMGREELAAQHRTKASATGSKHPDIAG